MAFIWTKDYLMERFSIVADLFRYVGDNTRGICGGIWSELYFLYRARIFVDKFSIVRII